MKRMLVIALLVIMVLPPQVFAGQAPAARAANAVADITTEQIDLMVGRSAVIRMDRPIVRVSLSTTDIADALVTTPYELLVHGKLPGTISMLVWGDNGRMKTYDVAVRRDLSALEAQVKKLFPGEDIVVSSNGKDVVLSGVVSTKYIVDRASSLAVGYVEKPENVVNLIRQVEGPATNQVMLRVRFAEVSRSAMQELGAGFFTGPAGKGDWIARSTTQQQPAPTFDQDKGLVFSDFLNLFFFNTEEQLGAVVKALKGKGLFQSLAEPNLITQDGKEATFLAGGEYPYPVVQGSGANSAVTIVFKEFGVRLRFTPTVTADDMIQLKVAPEVSSLDFGNAVVLSGFRVPALATRRTETQVELRDGQTFAIAGMLDQNLNETMRRIPGIGDIPILGYLFKSQAYQKNNTELVVMITPHILRRDSPGVTPNLPGLVQPFLPQQRRVAPPPPAFATPMTALPQNEPAPATASVAPNAPVVRNAAFATVAPDAAVAPNAPGAPRSSAAVENAPAAAVVPLTPAALPAPRVPEVDKRAVVADRKTVAKAAEQARKDELQRAEQERKQAELQRKQDQVTAKAEAIQAAQALAELARAQKIDNERQQIEHKAAEKRAVEQAAIDRKRFLEQQAEAARVKEAADRLSKEAEKLAKEKTARDAELSRLVEQYKKLTAVTQ